MAFIKKTFNILKYLSDWCTCKLWQAKTINKHILIINTWIITKHYYMQYEWWIVHILKKVASGHILYLCVSKLKKKNMTVKCKHSYHKYHVKEKQQCNVQFIFYICMFCWCHKMKYLLQTLLCFSYAIIHYLNTAHYIFITMFCIYIYFYVLYTAKYMNVYSPSSHNIMTARTI